MSVLCQAVVYLQCGFACCRSVASICKDHHKACSLSRSAQHARASAA